MADELEYMDVEVINIPLEDGGELECAIMDEFEIDDQGYIVLSPIEGDQIGEDMYIYRCREEGDEYVLDSIDDDNEFAEVSAIYEQLLDELEGEEDDEEDAE